MMAASIFHNNISKRFLKSVAIITIFLISVSTAAMGVFTYYSQNRKFQEQLSQIETSYLEVIRSAMWANDREMLHLALMGIGRTPGIAYVDIHCGDKLVCKVDNNILQAATQHRFPVIHRYNGKDLKLGELHIIASSAYARRNILNAVIRTVLLELSAVFVICALVLMLIYRTVIIRLLPITEYTSSLSLDHLGEPLVLKAEDKPPDEITKLAEGINLMRENLRLAFKRKDEVEKQLEWHLCNLEQTVSERTASLNQANERLQEEIEERKQVEQQREKLIAELQEALSKVKTMSGLLPICANCKRIRDDQGYWSQVEAYISQHSDAAFSHGICPDCLRKLYPDIAVELEKR